MPHIEKSLQMRRWEQKKNHVGKDANFCRLVFPAGVVQQRRVPSDREPDSRAAAEDQVSVLEDGQGAHGHPDQRASPYMGPGVQPPAER